MCHYRVCMHHTVDLIAIIFCAYKYWGTGIRGLMRGMATLPKVTRSYCGKRQNLEDPQVSLR